MITAADESDECSIGQLLPVLSPSNASCVSNATNNILHDKSKTRTKQTLLISTIQVRKSG